jgi:hypothetical protein
MEAGVSQGLGLKLILSFISSVKLILFYKFNAICFNLILYSNFNADLMGESRLEINFDPKFLKHPRFQYRLLSLCILLKL